MDIEFGKSYRDTITGVEGRAVGSARYMNGCERVQLEWAKDGDVKSEWFDTQRLELVATGERQGAAVRAGGPPTRGDAPR